MLSTAYDCLEDAATQAAYLREISEPHKRFDINRKERHPLSIPCCGFTSLASIDASSNTASCVVTLGSCVPDSAAAALCQQYFVHSRSCAASC